MVKIQTMAKNCKKLRKMADKGENHEKWRKMSKIMKNGRKGRKSRKMVENGENHEKW